MSNLKLRWLIVDEREEVKTINEAIKESPKIYKVVFYLAFICLICIGVDTIIGLICHNNYSIFKLAKSINMNISIAMFICTLTTLINTGICVSMYIFAFIKKNMLWFVKLLIPMITIFIVQYIITFYILLTERDFGLLATMTGNINEEIKLIGSVLICVIYIRIERKDYTESRSIKEN